MAVSGLTSSNNNLVLSGALMYIDDDTTASAIIGGESLQFSAEMAKLMAGKGVKVQVTEALKSFGVAFAFECYEITAVGFGILFGGSVVTESGYTKWRIKNKMSAPAPHRFKFVITKNDDKDIEITFWRAKNTNYGNIAFDGQDFSKMPCIVKPEPINPGDPNEVQVDVVFKN
jgi:hypothetical protein